MIGLDTNVLVRYFAQDDPKQAKLASRFINQRCTPAQPGFINHIVLCEVVWVITHHFKIDKEAICQILEQILYTEQFMVEDAKLVWKALELYRSRKIDFADSLISLKNLQAGCEFTSTLDQAASKAMGFRLCR